MAGDELLGVEWDGLDALVRAIRAEEDGKALRKDLAKEVKKAVEPAVADARSGVMAIRSAGLATSPALRPAIAKRIKAEVKLGGRWTGVRVKARKTVNVRGFANAPKRTQSSKGWRTKSWGREPWRQQQGKTDWFDEATKARADEVRDGVLKAMADTARRIAGRGGA